MKDLRTLLEESDPLRGDPGLQAADAQAIRRAMLGAASTMSTTFWPRALPVAALVVLMVVAGMTIGRRLRAPEPAGAGGQIADSAADHQRRQVQFSTPGGTRIIWTIDPNFQLGVAP
jgi:hypothetical protein